MVGLAETMGWLPWHGHTGRQILMPLQRTAPPGAKGGFSDVHAVSLFIFARRPAVVVMIFISASALFICRFSGMLASCIWQPTSGPDVFAFRESILKGCPNIWGRKIFIHTGPMLQGEAIANDLDPCFSICPKVRFFENPLLCLSSGFTKRDTGKGTANRLPLALLRSWTPKAGFTILLFEAKEQGGDAF